MKGVICDWNLNAPAARGRLALDEAFSGLFQATRKLGFDAVIYDYTPVPRSLEGELITPSLLKTCNVPEDMRQLWCERGYYQLDPVQHCALESCAPFVWSYQRPDNSMLRGRLNNHATAVTDYMREHNMPCGATVPLHLPNGSFVTHRHPYRPASGTGNQRHPGAADAARPPVSGVGVSAV